MQPTAMSVHPNSPEMSEPNTPLWLPAIGALLFALAGVWWATRPVPPAIVADTVADAGSEGTPAANAANPAGADAGAPQGLAAGGPPRPGSQPRSARPSMDPGKAGDIQRMLNRMPKQK
jgi:hypothetical protein